MKDIYAALGVKRRINAAGTLTRLGGALMDDEIVAAVRDVFDGQDGLLHTLYQAVKVKEALR